MPLCWTIELTEAPRRPLAWRFDVLHAVACGFFSEREDRHAANDKPFTAQLTGDRSLRLIWLDDRNVPRIGDREKLHVGEQEIAVAGTHRTTVPYEDIETGPLTTALRWVVRTPALFRHNGHNYPLPDPYVVFASLARRYRLYRPGTLNDDTIRSLGKSVVITHHRIRTRRFSWHGHTDSGFTGDVGFGIDRSAPPHLRQAFTTLSRFADLAGIGRGTTHGLGATSVSPKPASEVDC